VAGTDFSSSCCPHFEKAERSVSCHQYCSLNDSSESAFGTTLTKPVPRSNSRNDDGQSPDIQELGSDRVRTSEHPIGPKSGSYRDPKSRVFRGNRSHHGFGWTCQHQLAMAGSSSSWAVRLAGSSRRGGGDHSSTSLGGYPGHFPNSVSGKSFSRSDHGVFCGS
jgi:hypothetical protein